MSRPIKFRVWYNNQWQTNINGLPISIDLNGNGVMFSDYDEGINKTCIYSLGEKFVIQQFTGLLDKNGKEIYEGDILSFKDINGVAGFKDGYFYLNGKFEPNYHGDVYYMLCNCVDCEETESALIIGNIFENPDLLKS